MIQKAVATAAAIAMCFPLEKTKDIEFIILGLGHYFSMQLKTFARVYGKRERKNSNTLITCILSRDVTKPQAQTKNKECALCGTTLPAGSEISICRECMKCADCCVGLESLRD